MATDVFRTGRRAPARRIHLHADGGIDFLGVFLALLVTGSVWLAAPGTAAPVPSAVAEAERDLTQLSVEELANLPVTSVSKKPEKLSHAAAAITVITQSELQQSGATTIAEALRLAPGLEVARVDSHTWAVSSRGFNDPFANKLLVLIDGRSVYTPLFSGVYWDVQDTMIEDIDRIEVIRGPGATLWGANAVNGVINIITKSAKETQGGLLVGGGGTEELGFGSVRYGGKLGESAFYRVYAKYFSRDSSVVPDGDTADDRWQMGRIGFRMDWDVSSASALTLQGDAYGGQLDQTYNFPSLTSPTGRQLESKKVDVSGGNLLGRWHQEFSASSISTLQLYYDRTRRDAEDFFVEDRNTYDLDWQHRLEIGERQDWVVGAGYRLSTDSIGGSFLTSFDPKERSSQLFSLFAQDSIALVSDRLQLTLGSKFEHNDYTGFEVQPGARLLWTPTEHQSVWASVARAVRTPSRAENDIRLNDRVVPGAPATVYSIFGNGRFDSEKLLAFETGYRIRPHARVTLDAAAFCNLYDDLRTTEFVGAGPNPSLPGTPTVLRLDLDNKAKGETYGLELTASWQATDWWRLRGTYSFIDMQLHRKDGSNSTDSEDGEGRTPEHQFSIFSSIDLPWNVRFDTTLRYVDRLPEDNIDSYLALDVRLAWQVSKNVELSIVGQNLLDDRHREFYPVIIPTQSTEIQRSIYGKISIRF